MIADPCILFVKPNTISAADKEVLCAAGVIVVDIDDPSSVKFVRAGMEISGSQMLQCAARALKHSRAATEEFGKLVAAYLETIDD